MWKSWTPTRTITSHSFSLPTPTQLTEDPDPDLLKISTFSIKILNNLRRDSLADRPVGDSPVDVVSTVEGHPLVVLGAVDGHTVLLALLAIVRLSLHPVGPGHWLATRVDEAALPVDVVGAQPVGREAEGSPVRSSDVLHYLGLLSIVLGLRQVAFVIVAALHRIEPAHPVSVEVSAAAPEEFIKFWNISNRNHHEKSEALMSL